MAGALSSMTGFGRGEAEGPSGRVRVELKSVNHKGFDLRARLPRELSRAETEVAAAVRAAVPRGRVELSAEIDRGPRSGGPRLDLDALRALEPALRELAEQHDAIEHRITTGQILMSAALFTTSEDPAEGDAWREAFQEAARAATADLLRSRAREGEGLLEVLTERLRACAEVVEGLAERADGAPQRLAEALQERLSKQDLSAVDPGRLAQEVALLADRADVTEELDRLRLHLAHFEEMLAASGPIGRKLDFLCQELGREANTVASKASDAPMAQLVVELKAGIEQLREQVQNVE